MRCLKPSPLRHSRLALHTGTDCVNLRPTGSRSVMQVWGAPSDTNVAQYSPASSGPSLVSSLIRINRCACSSCRNACVKQLVRNGFVASCGKLRLSCSSYVKSCACEVLKLIPTHDTSVLQFCLSCLSTRRWTYKVKRLRGFFGQFSILKFVYWSRRR